MPRHVFKDLRDRLGQDRFKRCAHDTEVSKIGPCKGSLDAGKTGFCQGENMQRERSEDCRVMFCGRIQERSVQIGEMEIEVVAIPLQTLSVHGSVLRLRLNATRLILATLQPDLVTLSDGTDGS